MVDFNAGGGVVGMPGPFEGFNNAVNSTNQTNAYLGNLNNTVTSPGFDPFAQSGGFGNQTDFYAGQGAAYGRATGGFGGLGGNNDIIGGGYPSGSVERGPDLPNISGSPTYGGPVAYDFRSGQAPPVEQPAAYDFRTAQQPVQDWNAYFTKLTNPAKDAAPDPSSGGGGAFSGGSIFGGTAPSAMPDYQKLLGYTPDASLGWQSQSPAYTPPPAAQYFSQQPQAPFQDYGYPAAYDFRSGQAPPVGQPAAYDFRTAQQPSDRDQLAQQMSQIRSPPQMNMPNIGYNPGMQNWFANPGMSGGTIGDRSGYFPNSGSPSQYYQGTYDGAQGPVQGQSQMPQGFATPFGADNSGGALTFQDWLKMQSLVKQP